MNRIFIMGNIAADAEIKKIGDTCYCSFRLADSSRQKNGETLTTWYGCLRRDPNEKLSQCLKRGTKVSVVGKLSVREWKTQSGENRTSLEIWVDELGFMSAKDTLPRLDSRSGSQPMYTPEPQQPAPQDAYDDPLPF